VDALVLTDRPLGQQSSTGQPSHERLQLGGLCIERGAISAPTICCHKANNTPLLGKQPFVAGRAPAARQFRASPQQKTAGMTTREAKEG
jgi:hypothetical protein